MKRLLALVAALLLFNSSAHAVSLMTLTGAGGTGVPPTPPPAYSGPGDVVGSATAWYGLRAYSASFASSLGAAVQLCTASDALCTDIHVTATGGLNSADLTTSGCGSITTCTIKTFYDQTGNGHTLTQATIGTRPTFNPNGVSSGKPAAKFDVNVPQQMSVSFSATINNYAYTLLANSDRTASSFRNVWTEVNGGTGISYIPGDHWAFISNADLDSSVTSTHGTFYALTGTTDNSGNARIDQSGTVTTGTISYRSISGPNLTVGSNGITSSVTEFGLWPVTFSAGNTTSMNSNMQTYWGI